MYKKRNYLREKSTQNICEVEIKEESTNEDEYTSPPPLIRSPSMQTPSVTNLTNYNHLQNGGISVNRQNDGLLNGSGLIDDGVTLKKRFKLNNNNHFDGMIASGSTLPTLSINNVAATLDTLNLLKNQMNNRKQRERDHRGRGDHHRRSGGGGGVSDDFDASPTTETNGGGGHLKQFLDMQTREHLVRMQILQIELETAKFKRDTAEINRQFSLKRFSESSSTTMTPNNVDHQEQDESS